MGGNQTKTTSNQGAQDIVISEKRTPCNYIALMILVNLVESFGYLVESSRYHDVWLILPICHESPSQPQIALQQSILQVSGPCLGPQPKPEPAVMPSNNKPQD